VGQDLGQLLGEPQGRILPVSRRPSHGFTLIEILVALAIAAILMVLAAPGYAVWIGDSQIRAGAETVAAGLRFAMGEAIKRNEQVEIVLDSTTKTGGWVAQLVSDGSTLQSGFFVEGADRVQVTATPAGNTKVTFNALGQVAATNADGTDPFDTVDVTVSVTGSRPLRVLVGGGRTGIKICDPAWAAPDPKGCPAP
jgi:type IV fimbrial biogenesis protein FimT